jgi:hypothetical protein
MAQPVTGLEGFSRNLRLSPHPTARDRAIATTTLSPGSVVFSTEPLATVLIDREKGRRCDACHVLRSKNIPLRKCTGCVSYWYCGPECKSSDLSPRFCAFMRLRDIGQSRHWKAEHGKICKRFNEWVTSPGFQGLPSHEQSDAVLLSHLVGRWYASSALYPHPEEGSLFSTFMSLLPGPPGSDAAPPICRMKSSAATLSKYDLNTLYSRFGNNNFAIHSHLYSYAHGIFPIASRVFNHSCLPNAAARYIINRGQTLRMDIVALRDIEIGEEVCLKSP